MPKKKQTKFIDLDGDVEFGSYAFPQVALHALKELVRLCESGAVTITDIAYRREGKKSYRIGLYVDGPDAKWIEHLADGVKIGPEMTVRFGPNA